jgi:hypothetical protein
VLLQDLLDAGAAAPRRVGGPEHADDVHHPVRRRREDRRCVLVPPEKPPRLARLHIQITQTYDLYKYHKIMG